MSQTAMTAEERDPVDSSMQKKNPFKYTGIFDGENKDCLLP